MSPIIVLSTFVSNGEENHFKSRDAVVAECYLDNSWEGLELNMSYEPQ
jgi:hypothetical protein